jgi:hypothetical protein
MRTFYLDGLVVRWGHPALEPQQTEVLSRVLIGVNPELLVLDPVDALITRISHA